jgi:hypothetical protein
MFRLLGHLQVDSKIIKEKYRVQPLVLHIINNWGGGRDLILQQLWGCVCVNSIMELVLVTVV